jgi:hypothetical protein
MIFYFFSLSFSWLSKTRNISSSIVDVRPNKATPTSSLFLSNSPNNSASESVAPSIESESVNSNPIFVINLHHECIFELHVQDLIYLVLNYYFLHQLQVNLILFDVAHLFGLWIRLFS